ncbi:MAG TPA: DegV family protein, partial [Trueperaceae bacterium]|nr:DegV family protein [Trueperaceae bacterium]
DFAEVFDRVTAAGAEQILVITLTAELSGTYQSAVIAAEDAKAQVKVFDSRAASLGHGEMARVAAALRDRGADLDEIVPALERIRDTNLLLFTVGTMEYLQKGGRIGKASAMLGSLLNIKPILTLEDGKIEPLSRARGMKKAQQEMVARFKAYVDAASVPVIANLVHIQDVEAAEGLRRALEAAGVSYTLNGIHELGAVIGSHVGPNTFGIYAHHAVE